MRTPPGCGGPVWGDDPTFDVDRHVTEVVCGPPGDDGALAETALGLVLEPLPRDAPLWAVRLVTGLADHTVALVVVLHHVLADGVGGLTVLAGLLDPDEPSPGDRFPQPRPKVRELAGDALSRRLRALRRAPRSWLLLRRSFRAGGGFHPEPVADCSLLRRTGRRRAVAVVEVDQGGLREAAHRHGATTNDAVLVAVAGALGRVLASRGEHVERLVVAVPVSGRTGPQAEPGDEDGLGNAVSPMLVPVPVAGPVADRLTEVAQTVRARRADATAPAPIALLGWLFRALAAVGGYRWFLAHQRRFHTVVSHVRGPDATVSFAGVRVRDAVPFGVGELGSCTAYVEVLSYAGTLGLTATVDPDRFPDLDVWVSCLREELSRIAGAAALAR